MRARWVFNELTPELPGVGMTTVASWWPGKYWLVSTIQLDESSVTPGSSKNFPFVGFIQPTLVGVGSTGFLVPYEQAPSAHESVSNGPLIYRASVCVPIGKAVPSPNKFVTQIFRCNKIAIRSFDGLLDWLYAATRLKGVGTGTVMPFDQVPLFEREYSRLSDARAGHRETVDLLVQGQLEMKS
jgi:hypothetical protein